MSSGNLARNAPRVTVFIASYNAAAYIAEAIESVLAQSYEDYELLIVDDCSTDDTLQICERYAAGDDRIRIEQLPKNVGRARVRQHGLEHARGEYLAILDADDRCLAGRLSRQVAFLDAHPAIDVVATRWQGIDQHGAPFAANNNVGAMSPDTVTCFLLFRGIIHNPTVMARRVAMLTHGYDPDFEIAEDYDLWARMIGAHRFALLNERLTAYRRHQSQASTARAEESRIRRCEIQAREIAALGVAATPQDIRLHNLLYTGRRLFREVTGRPLDRQYAQWSADWLMRLIAANAACGRFPEPAFRRLCARLFFGVCQKAAKTDGAVVWRLFLASPLARAWPAARFDDLWQAVGSRIAAYRQR